MRYLLLLLTFICFSKLSAQVTRTTSIGLADVYCTDPSDPDNCFNVPIGNNSLTYFPGVDGDYVVTYKVAYNSGTAISQLSISDSKHGIVIPLTAVNISVSKFTYLMQPCTKSNNYVSTFNANNYNPPLHSTIRTDR